MQEWGMRMNILFSFYLLWNGNEFVISFLMFGWI